MDLRFNLQNSVFCKAENQNIIEVAGLTFAYDYAFSEFEGEICIYNAKQLKNCFFRQHHIHNMVAHT